MIDIKNLLITNHRIFEQSAAVCIESYTQKKCLIKEPWDVVERIQGDFEQIFSMGVANNDFQGVAVIGVQNQFVETFFEGIESAMVIDAFGEITNTFCGMIMDYKEITEAFGVLKQALPQHSSTATYFPKAWGIHGKMYLNEAWLYVGYALRPTRILFTAAKN